MDLYRSRTAELQVLIIGAEEGLRLEEFKDWYEAGMGLVFPRRCESKQISGGCDTEATHKQGIRAVEQH